MNLDSHMIDGPAVVHDAATRQRARLACAVNATDAAELRMFLDALDLRGGSDE